jgi:hypothetical protein
MCLACCGGLSLCCFDMKRFRNTLPLSYCAMSWAFPSILPSLFTFSAALRSYMIPDLGAMPIFFAGLAHVVILCMHVPEPPRHSACISAEAAREQKRAWNAMC